MSKSNVFKNCNGNRIEITYPTLEEDFSIKEYDSKDRLVFEHNSDGEVWYDYDKNGDRYIAGSVQKS